MNRAGVSVFLQQVSYKIAGGNVIFRQGTEELVLKLPLNIILEIQGEDKDRGTKGEQHS